MDPEAPIGDMGELTAPLFPLPDVVLFPRAVLPLHIFEERYRVMTTDVLSAQRLIAVARLLPGWEKDYYQAPAVEPIVCVGRVLNCEQLPDGKFNLLLQGELRAQIVDEISRHPYRTARLRPLRQVSATRDVLENHRHRLIKMVDSPRAAATSIGQHLRKIVLSPLPTEEIADLLAFNFLQDAAMKQSLLAEPDVAKRVAQLVDAMDELLPGLLYRGEVGNKKIGLN